MKGYNVLVVDDDKAIVEAIEIYLRGEGYNIFKAYDGAEALEVIKEEEIHLIIMDIMMPKMDGTRATLKIREEKEIPIIMLSAKSEDTDKILGLNIGADDYVTKPFSPKILIAKIKALLKRTVSDDDDFNPTQDYNGLTINKLAHEVKINNEALTLSPKEFELLVYLSDNMGISLSRDVILDNVWGIDYYGDLRTVDTNIKRLREKLGTKSNYIITVRGSGYKFEVQNEK